MLYTIIQIIAFQALFLLVYDLFLKRETFFNYNRAYLLVTSLLSLILPFLKFPELKTMVTKDVVIHLPEVFIGIKTPSAYDIQIAEQAGIILKQPQTPIWQSIALIGIALATLIFLFKIIKLYGLKHRNPKRWQGNVLVVKLIKSSAAFSFFNTIFMGERIPEAQKPIIYKHELVHIKEFHTLDLLFFEILRIVFWFSPLVYIYQNRIKELHEYIADANAVKQSGKADYYQSLLNQVFDVSHVSFTNTFFKKSLIKKRIAMLQKMKSKQLNLIKYVLIIPMVLGMLIYTSTEVRAQQKTESKNEISQELTDEELIKKYYDELVEMEKRGATFIEIAQKSGMDKVKLEKYLLSRTEYLQRNAYMKYVADGMIQRKSEEGILTQTDLDTAALMRPKKEGSYQNYKAFKKTKEAKERWELSTQDGILKLFVEDADNFTKEEQKRYDALKKQLKADDYFDKLIVTDGVTSMTVDSPDTMFPIENEVYKVVETIEVPFSVVDETPTIVECKDATTNEERKNCISQFINKHVNKNFNTKLADSLSPGKKRIFVQFKIDTQGNITSVKARGPSAELEEEAKRVIKTLPQFVPGRQKRKLVVVPYSLPIVFQVAGGNIEQVTKTHNELVAQRDRILQNSSEKNPVVRKLNDQISALKASSKNVSDSLYLEILKKREESLINKAVDSTRLDNIPYSVVEVAPYLTECKSLNSALERKNCTSRAVNKFIGKNFNTKVTDSLSPGRKRIFVQFKIDTEGKIKDIKARGPSVELEEEAKRVISTLPQFVPGRQKGELVVVPYALPIVFQVHDTKKD